MRDNGVMHPRYWSLYYWCLQAYEQAESKGFHDQPSHPGARIALIHSELSELLEAFRTGKQHTPCEKCPDISNAQEEAADVFLSLADFCQEFGIDLGRAVEVKHQFNATRPVMHGGKLF